MTRIYKRWRTAPRVERSTLTDAEREAIARRIVAAFPAPISANGKRITNAPDRPLYAAVALFCAEVDEGRSIGEVGRRFFRRSPHNLHAENDSARFALLRLVEAGILKRVGGHLHGKFLLVKV